MPFGVREQSRESPRLECSSGFGVEARICRDLAKNLKTPVPADPLSRSEGDRTESHLSPAFQSEPETSVDAVGQETSPLAAHRFHPPCKHGFDCVLDPCPILSYGLRRLPRMNRGDPVPLYPPRLGCKRSPESAHSLKVLDDGILNHVIVSHAILFLASKFRLEGQAVPDGVTNA